MKEELEHNVDSNGWKAPELYYKMLCVLLIAYAIRCVIILALSPLFFLTILGSISNGITMYIVKCLQWLTPELDTKAMLYFYENSKILREKRLHCMQNLKGTENEK